MKKRKTVYYVISFVIFSFVITSHAQPDSQLSKSQILQRITAKVGSADPFHYKTQMRLKEMGSDTFDSRHFEIRYRSNAENSLYGYDWEIAEDFEGYKYTFMVIPESMYTIYEGSKTIRKSPLPDQINPRNNPEVMRGYFLLTEVISTYADSFAKSVIVIDSNNHFYLKRQMKFGTQELFVSKDSYLPTQSISRIKNEALDLTQVLEINFFYTDDSHQLPDTAFSPEHYMLSGFQEPSIENNSSSGDGINELSADSLYQILDYPFLSETGDTTYISGSNAGYILLGFWYASCAPCLQAMPVTDSLAGVYSDSGLQVIGINCFDKGIRKTLVPKIRQRNIDMPFLFGSKDLTYSIGLRGFPAYFLITPGRKVEFINGGVEEVKEVLKEIFGR